MITTILLPMGLAFIMFSMGLALVVNDFKRVIHHPVAMTFGLISQMLLLPLIAFGLVALLPLEPEIAMGLIILAAVPGGITSNLLTHIANGDTALSVSLTAITSLAGVITVPFIVNLGLTRFTGATEIIPLPIDKMVIGVFVISTLPLLLGMAMRHLRPAWALQLEPRARRLAVILFISIVLATFMGQWGSISANFIQVGPAVIALNITTLLVAFFGTRIFRLNRRQGVAITLECGLQNATMGIFVAATLLSNTTMVIPSIIYALVMNVSAAAVIFLNTAPARQILSSR